MTTEKSLYGVKMIAVSKAGLEALEKERDALREDADALARALSDWMEAHDTGEVIGGVLHEEGATALAKHAALSGGEK